jgi:hypothetical protein
MRFIYNGLPESAPIQPGGPTLWPARHLEDGMAYLYPIWLFFAAFFFYSAYIHWREGAQEIRPFTIRQRDTPQGDGQVDPVLAEANKQFVGEFNAYLGGMNRLYKSRHRSAAIGYILAGVICLLAMVFMIFMGSAV